MKRLLAFLLSVVMGLFLCGCGYSSEDLDSAREAGYQDGYYDGVYEGNKEGYEDGYEDGYSAGLEAQDSMQWDAEHYAREKSGWNPEEAMGIIEDFENQTAHYNDFIPSVDEYIEAVHSLYYFYEYYYSN